MEELYKFTSEIIDKIENYEERQKARIKFIAIIDKNIIDLDNKSAEITVKL